MKRYTQLTQAQRYRISILQAAGQRPAAIARLLGVHRSTLYRELRRNRQHGGGLYTHLHHPCPYRNRITAWNSAAIKPSPESLRRIITLPVLMPHGSGGRTGMPTG